jgi:superfamily II DNA/RNA helicase
VNQTVYQTQSVTTGVATSYTTDYRLSDAVPFDSIKGNRITITTSGSGAASVSGNIKATASTTIEQRMFYFTPSRKDRSFAEKRATLRALIRSEGEGCTNAIIFCNRKMDVDVVAKSLKQHGFNASPIHGDLDQSVRTRTLDGFRDGSVRLLVASDVAARGLDIPAVSHVFNFDVPSHPEDYIHRIGRTGRAGRLGKAFTIATPHDDKYIGAIEHLVKMPIPRAEAPAVDASDEEDIRSTTRPERKADDSRSEERSGRSRDRGRRGGSRDKAPMEPVAVDTPDFVEMAEVIEAPVEVSQQPRREERPRDDRSRSGDRRGDRREPRRDDRPVIGMGDHMPDFLLRSFAPPAAD